MTLTHSFTCRKPPDLKPFWHSSHSVCDTLSIVSNPLIGASDSLARKESRPSSGSGVRAQEIAAIRRFFVPARHDGDDQDDHEAEAEAERACRIRIHEGLPGGPGCAEPGPPWPSRPPAAPTLVEADEEPGPELTPAAREARPASLGAQGRTPPGIAGSRDESDSQRQAPWYPQADPPANALSYPLPVAAGRQTAHRRGSILRSGGGRAGGDGGAGDPSAGMRSPHQRLNLMARLGCRGAAVSFDPDGAPGGPSARRPSQGEVSTV